MPESKPNKNPPLRLPRALRLELDQEIGRRLMAGDKTSYGRLLSEAWEHHKAWLAARVSEGVVPEGIDLSTKGTLNSESVNKSTEPELQRGGEDAKIAELRAAVAELNKQVEAFARSGSRRTGHKGGSGGRSGT